MSKQINKKSSLWKAYFVIDCLIFVFTLFNLFKFSLSLINVIYLPITLLGLLAVYSYAFSKKLFNLIVWKVIFLLVLIRFIFTIYRTFVMTNFLALASILLIFVIVISLPELYVTYKLSFGSKK